MSMSTKDETLLFSDPPLNGTLSRGGVIGDKKTSAFSKGKESVTFIKETKKETNAASRRLRLPIFERLTISNSMAAKSVTAPAGEAPCEEQGIPS